MQSTMYGEIGSIIKNIYLCLVERTAKLAMAPQVPPNLKKENTIFLIFDCFWDSFLFLVQSINQKFICHNYLQQIVKAHSKTSDNK